MLDLSFRVSERFRPFAILAPGFEQLVEGASRVGGLRLTDVVPVAPFVAVQVAVEQLPAKGLAAGLASAEGGDHVLATYDPADGSAAIEVRRGGRTSVVARGPARLEAPFGFAFVLCENQVTVVADTGAGWQPLVTAREAVASVVDLRDPVTLAAYAFTYGARADEAELGVREVRAGPFGYTGLRDPHLVQRPDGGAVVQDGKAYLTFTCAGMGFFQQAHCGVFTLDLAEPTRLQQVAQLYAHRDGLLLGDHAGQLVVGGTDTVAALSSWGDFDDTGVHVRHTATGADLLHGVHLLETEPLELPTPHSAWDPSLTRIGDRWYVAFVESPSQDPFDFHPALAAGATEQPYDTELELIGVDDSMREGEGTLIAQVAGSWHVLASNKDAREYPVYDLDLRRLGTLDAPYLSNIPHPQLVDRPGGGHLLVTFEGTQYGEEVLGYGGHGDVVVMTAT